MRAITTTITLFFVDFVVVLSSVSSTTMLHAFQSSSSSSTSCVRTTLLRNRMPTFTRLQSAVAPPVVHNNQVLPTLQLIRNLTSTTGIDVEHGRGQWKTYGNVSSYKVRNSKTNLCGACSEPDPTDKRATVQCDQPMCVDHPFSPKRVLHRHVLV